MKKTQWSSTLNVSMLIADVIKALMSLLLSALLLPHLFNSAHYCAYGALTPLEIPSLGDHLLL